MLLQYIFSASVFAAELGLIAFSFNLSYRALGFANFSNVEYVTIGSLDAVSLAPHIPIAAAGALGNLAAGAAAAAMNLAVFAPLSSASLGTRMIASAGLAIAVRGINQIAFGVDPRRFDVVPHIFIVRHAFITSVQIAIICIAIGCVAAFAWLLRFTRTGRNVRAVADNPTLAESRGVSSSRIRNEVCFISGAIAGLAGVLAGADTVVTPDMGLAFLIPMFAACIVGGAGSPFGALIGAACVSAATTTTVSVDFGQLVGAGPTYLGSQWKSTAAFIVLIAVLLVRPTGFFGPHRERV
jgi:branched-subunit amino acid ABC-type transport system permease component